MFKATTLSTSLRALVGVTLVAGLAACSGASRPQPAGVNDPHEAGNRKVWAFMGDDLIIGIPRSGVVEHRIFLIWGRRANRG